MEVGLVDSIGLVKLFGPGALVYEVQSLPKRRQVLLFAIVLYEDCIKMHKTHH